jgi:predicted dienelactone hydrolase
MFAPFHYGSGGFLPWYLLQAKGQVVNFIQHCRTNTLISKLSKSQFSGHSGSRDTMNPIFEDVTTPIRYIECRWLRSLREFLGTINGSLVD